MSDRREDFVNAIDRRRLSKVFVNLIENAIQHSPSGSVVTVEAQKVLDGGHEWVQCAVHDSGPGISADDLPKIFEPLFSTKSFGVGLGLPTVKQIMEQHGGGIDVAPLAEGGTEVKLWLALAEPMLEAAE